MYGREKVDPPRRDPPTSGSSSQGSSFQSSQRAGWQNRPGQNVPAFSGSQFCPYKHVLKFGTTKIPKLTKSTLVNTEVHLLIQYIH